MNRLQTIDADTLQSTAYEPVSFVVDDLLPQGLHLLAGAPKIGKSWLALWLCLCAAQGKPLWTFATRPCEVLYLCLEDSFQRIQSRLFDLTEDAPPTLHFAVMSQQLHNGLVEQIEQFLKEHPQTRLIVIDTLQRIRTAGNAKEKGFENTIFLADDGYSGTNFERPSWKKIVEMIEAGQVANLIVKDASRLGREYLQVGYYMEIYFPQKNVRFIAVNDGVDSTVESSNDFNPIRNWANELHAKDTSRKVRAVMKMKAEQGERLGGRPPYGYRKSDGDANTLVPDEDTAPVVKRIFSLCAAGNGPKRIATILTKEQVVNPSNAYYRKTGKSHRGLDTTRPCLWSSNSVTSILNNEVYLGHSVGLRTTTISYKNKQRVERPESERFVVKNTHEALVTQEQWDIVQEVRQHKKRVPKHMDEPNIFSGLVFCADCGKPLVLHRASTMKRTEYNFKCYTYGKKGKTVCTPHHIREFELKAVVLEDLRRVTHFARMKEKQFAAYISSKNTLELRREMNTIQKDLDTMRRRREELSKLFKRLYEDNVLGRVTDEQYRMLAGDYTVEQKALEEQIPEKEARLEKLKAASANVNTFVEKAKQYTAIDELTPELLRLFIQRIEVGERTEKYSRSSHQSIRIVYRDIGTVDSAMEQGEAQPRIAPPLSEVFQLPA